MKIDLHTHSSISYDGGITGPQYSHLLEENPDLYLAITDHNEVSLAIEMNTKWGNRIIVGEEIMTQDGEVIGLFLSKRVTPALSLSETITHIKAQNGLVYIPHPLEKTRKGLPLEKIQANVNDIDIIEGFNARSREGWLRSKINSFAKTNSIVMASSSDAHGVRGLHTALTIIGDVPTKENLVLLLRTGHMQKTRAPLLSFIDPLKNKIKKIVL